MVQTQEADRRLALWLDDIDPNPKQALHFRSMTCMGVCSVQQKAQQHIA